MSLPTVAPSQGEGFVGVSVREAREECLGKGVGERAKEKSEGGRVGVGGRVSKGSRKGGRREGREGGGKGGREGGRKGGREGHRKGQRGKEA